MFYCIASCRWILVCQRNTESPSVSRSQCSGCGDRSEEQRQEEVCSEDGHREQLLDDPCQPRSHDRGLYTACAITHSPFCLFITSTLSSYTSTIITEPSFILCNLFSHATTDIHTLLYLPSPIISYIYPHPSSHTSTLTHHLIHPASLIFSYIDPHSSLYIYPHPSSHTSILIYLPSPIILCIYPYP